MSSMNPLHRFSIFRIQLLLTRWRYRLGNIDWFMVFCLIAIIGSVASLTVTLVRSFSRQPSQYRLNNGLLISGDRSDVAEAKTDPEIQTLLVSAIYDWDLDEIKSIVKQHNVDLDDDPVLCRELVSESILALNEDITAYLLGRDSAETAQGRLGIGEIEIRKYGDCASAMRSAIVFGNLKTVSWLLDEGVDPTSMIPDPTRISFLRDKRWMKGDIFWREHPAFFAACEDSRLDILKLLVQHGTDLEGTDFLDRKAIEIAAFEGQKQTVEYLHRQGCSSRYKLHMAAATDDADLIDNLLGKGYPINYRTHSQGRTALQYAINSGSVSATLRLIDRGADVNLADRDGVAPLHLAASKGNLEMIHALLDAHAYANAMTMNGQTPLDRAYDDDDAACVLAKHGGVDGVEFSIHGIDDLFDRRDGSDDWNKIQTSWVYRRRANQLPE